MGQKIVQVQQIREFETPARPGEMLVALGRELEAMAAETEGTPHSSGALFAPSPGVRHFLYYEVVTLIEGSEPAVGMPEVPLPAMKDPRA